MANQITLFAEPNFQGRSVVITQAVPDLSEKPYNFNDMASSAKVEGKPWVLYHDPRYEGPGVTLPPGNYPDLRPKDANNVVSSLLPADLAHLAGPSGDDWFYFEDSSSGS